MSLFCEIDKKKTSVLIGALDPIMIAIDTSGSTAGSILAGQVRSAQMLLDSLRSKTKTVTAVSWNTRAFEMASVHSIKSSGGGTQPECIVPLLLQKKPKFLVLYTDGQCQASLFRRAMAESNARLPIIIVFTLGDTLANNGSTSVADLRRQIDMSVPEGVLASSNNVCIVVNSAQSHKVLMASGAFTLTYKPNANLAESTRISALPDFDMSLLAQVAIMEESAIPPGCLMLNAALYPQPLCLEALYAAQFSHVDAQLIHALSERTLLARYDLNRLHAMLVRHLSEEVVEKSTEYQAALERLLRAAAESKKSQEHIEARAAYERIRLQVRGGANDALRLKRAAIQRLLSIIADYRADANQFVLGSNRANRASVISSEAMHDLDCVLAGDSGRADSIIIEECPIFLQRGSACILLAETPGSDSKIGTLIERCTGDFSIDLPFHFGSNEMAVVTPGTYCADFGLNCDKNPITRQPVIASIVLVRDKRLLMLQLCRKFCGGREMWHMLYAFASLLANHVATNEWADAAVLTPYIEWLCQACTTSPDFKESIDVASRITLSDAIYNGIKNYASILRNRLPTDTRAMMQLLQVAAPTRYANLLGDIYKCNGMLRVLETFAKMLKLYKAGDSMLSHVIAIDGPYKEAVEPRYGLSAIIARLLFDDGLQFIEEEPKSRRGPMRFCNLAFQDAVDLALRVSKSFSDSTNPVWYLADAFNGESVNSVAGAVLPVIPKDNVHFCTGAKYSNCTVVKGIEHSVCVYCGFQQPKTPTGNQAMRDHFLAVYTPDLLFNGALFVKKAIAELGIAAEEDLLVRNAKRNLLHHHGVDHWVLHTKYCTETLQRFVRNIKAGLQPHGNFPN